jgi:chromosome partitioning protein
MAIKVSLINMKGGVGKSTLTVNLAWHYAAYSDWNRKVLVVDLDPQFNASQYLLGVSDYEAILNSNKPTVWDIFEQGTRIQVEGSRSPIRALPFTSTRTSATGAVFTLSRRDLNLHSP